MKRSDFLKKAKICGISYFSELVNLYPRSAHALLYEEDFDVIHWLEPDVGFLDNYRNLYDFFDYWDIHVCVNTMLRPFTTDSKRVFAWDIDTEHESFNDHEMYDTRYEAEDEAFNKAFQVLEQKLKDKNYGS